MQPKRDGLDDYEMEEYKAWRRRVFWSRVDKTPGLGPNGTCWEWVAGGTKAGYGLMYFGERRQYAHRISWFLEHGAWPVLHVCHKCDNPPCINPSHLFEGNDAANIADALAKGKMQHLVNGPGLRGESHGMVKLTDQYVMEIRRRYAMGEPIRELARVYGVVYGCITAITTGATWKHLPIIRRPNNRFKISLEHVNKIRSSSLSGSELASLYGVHRQTIYKIRTGKYGDEISDIKMEGTNA